MVVYRALPPATLGPSFCFFEHPSSFPPQGLNTCWSLCLEPIHPNVHRTDSLSFIFQPNEMSSKSLRWAPSLSRTPLLSTMSFPSTSLCHALLILINNMWKWVSDLVVCLQMIQYVVFDSFFFFWPYCTAYGNLVPWLGTESIPLALEAQSLNHWTAKEVPKMSVSWRDECDCCCCC